MNTMLKIFENKEYNELVEKISQTFICNARQNAFKAINKELVLSNWNTGKYIVEFEQKGNIKAEYGKKLLDKAIQRFNSTTRFGIYVEATS